MCRKVWREGFSEPAGRGTRRESGIQIDSGVPAAYSGTHLNALFPLISINQSGARYVINSSMISHGVIAFHVILAACVSVHILLTKRNSRAATAWLAVTWLSPLIGSAAYFLFGINRVERRALRMRHFNHRASTDLHNRKDRFGKQPVSRQENVDHGGDRISDHPIVHGNRLDIYLNGDEAYPAMIDAINKAKHSIALASYIFRLDEDGQKFADVLKKASDRGVDVKVLIDGIGGGIFRCPATAYLNAHGIEARRFLFSLLPWEMPYLNLRNHKKLLIIDGSTGFVGGMNLGSENLIRRRRQHQVRDTHFRISGPVVRQLMFSFAEDWHFSSGEELTGEIWLPAIPPDGDVAARVVSSGPDYALGKIERLFATAIVCARRRLRIVTPYFLPEERVSFLLELAATRGVKIDLVVPRKTDWFLFNWAMDGQLTVMNLDGFDCRRSPGPFDHSKLLTVDGKWCAFGSPNWDARSMRLNFEVLVECRDRETVKRIDAIIDEKLADAVRYVPDEPSALNLLSRLKNAAARLFMPYM